MLSRSFVGRDGELARLRSLWERGGIAIVRGDAGSGKSRLVREHLGAIRGSGAQVLVGRCSQSGAEVSLRPLREALMGLARAGVEPPGSVAAFVPSMARLVPDWGPAEGADASPLVLGEGILRLGSALASGAANTVLIIEDVHWADSETLSVIDYMADNCVGLPLLVLLTLRDGERGPGPDAVDALIGRRAAPVIDLHPLDAAQVEEMTRSCLGSTEPDPELVRTLVERSDGIPFLVEELLAAAAGNVSPGGSGRPAVTGLPPATPLPITTALPTSIAASVAVRMAALPEDVVQLVRHAAVLGRRFDWEVASVAAGVPTSDAPGLLRQAVGAQLIDVDGGEFKFRHALTRDAVLAELLAGEPAAIAGRTLSALIGQQPDLGGELLQLAADLAEMAGERERAARFLLDGARRAVADGSLTSAESMAERAGTLGSALSRNGDFAVDRDELLLVVRVRSGQLDRVREVGQRLLDRVQEPGRRSDVLLSLATAAVAAGDWDQAGAHVAVAVALVQENDARAATLDVLAAQIAMGRGDADSAASLAAAALARAEREHAAVAQCEALEVLGRVERVQDLAAADRAFSRAYEIARRNALPLWRIRALQELGGVDLYDSLSTQRSEQARAEASAAGAVSTIAVLDLQLAAVHGERVEVDEALAAARRCQEASRRFGLSTLAMGIALEAGSHAKAGRRREMDEAAEAARAVGEDEINVQIALGDAESTFHLVNDDLVAATAALDTAMVWFRRSGVSGFPIAGVWALLHTVLDDTVLDDTVLDDGDAGFDGEAARREVRALRFDTPMSRSMLDAADAVVFARSGDVVAAEAAFERADLGLARYQRGYRRALMRHLVTPSALADGWGEPLTWLRESLVSFEVLGLSELARRTRQQLKSAGAVVPRQGRGDSVVPPELAAMGITSREHDVLLLVARAMSNREIAELLNLSPRTVEKHVERLVMKSGSSRAELVDVVRSLRT